MTVIYGHGWQIASSIKMFDKQINIKGENAFHYFSDIDKEGIYIWHKLNESIAALPETKIKEIMIHQKVVILM